MNSKRLLKLADFLETVPPRKFSLVTWVQRMPTKPEGVREGSCGFAGCAVGWAVHAKLFRGLSFDDSDPEEVNQAPAYQGSTHFDAVKRLFDISFESMMYLFVDERYAGRDATPKQVAKRIRAFVKSGGVTSPSSGNQ